MKKIYIVLGLVSALLLTSGSSFLSVFAEEASSPAIPFEELIDYESKLDVSNFNYNFELNGKANLPALEEEVFFDNNEISDVSVFNLMERSSIEPGMGTVVNVPRAVYYLYDTSTSKESVNYISAEIEYTRDFPVLEEKNGRYRIVISGFEGWINKTAVVYTAANKVKGSSHYVVDGWNDLVHKLASNPLATSTNTKNLHSGTAPSYLKQGVIYYSFDGHYFYTNRNIMLNDYKLGQRNNSLNYTNPYYNYFQFLSYRSKTNHTGSSIDYRLSNNGYSSKSQSLIVGQASEFLRQMNVHGNNALLTFSTSLVESAWGTSDLSSGSNNIFSHAAFDSDPGSLTSYSSVAAAITAHNAIFLNGKYLNYESSSHLYDGGMLGNKESGINMSYASDPYWGEKISDSYYTHEDISAGFYRENKLPVVSDFENYRIGVTNDNAEINLRKEANTKQKPVSTFHQKNQSFIILDEEKNGENINGSKLWYKISSDHVLDKNRNVIPNYESNRLDLKYDFSNSHVYVHSSLVSVANEDRGEPKSPGWNFIDNKWYFANEKGIPKTGWIQTKGHWYYLNESGIMQTGWNLLNNDWYYMSTSGAMQTGWTKVGLSWFYLGGSGIMKTGWNLIDDNWFYMSLNGAMQTGWTKVNSSWYHMNDSGVMTTGWNLINASWYFMSSNGAMQTGWNKINNEWYFMTTNGIMQTGWTQVGSSWFYLGNSGTMQTGWIKPESFWYYLSDKGAMQVGWINTEEKWYFTNKSGAMQTGRLKIDGKWYVFESSGMMQ